MCFYRRENSSRTRRRLAMAGVPMTPPPRDAQPDQTPPVHCQMCHKELGVLSEAPALAKTSRPPKGFLATSRSPSRIPPREYQPDHPPDTCQLCHSAPCDPTTKTSRRPSESTPTR